MDSDYELTQRAFDNDGSQENNLPANSGYALDNRRRAALAQVDNANFSWSHTKVCIVAGVGFFTDAYELFAINIAATMLGYVYGGPDQSLSKTQGLGVKVAAQAGTLVGQLLFGWLADVLGRKKMYGIELLIIMVATFGQAVSGDAQAVNIIGVLVVWRFVMGLGIGGDYPLSAVISSEFASTRIRGRMMTAVFASQGLGNFCASLVAVIITAACKHKIINEPSATRFPTVDFMWRLFIGLGAVPAAVALYFRLTIPETPRFTMDVERNLDKAALDIQDVLSGKKTRLDENVVIQRINAPKASWADFIAYFGRRRNFQILFGTAYSWFVLDFAFYGLGLNASTILQDIGFFAKTRSMGSRAVYESLNQICLENLILSAVLIPGYWVTFLFIDSWGRKSIQLMGFSVLAVLFLILGFGYDKLTTSPKLFFSFYCIAGFFQNFGPNVTTFVIPGEIFPTRYRSTAHGISAASGKLGAIIAQVIFSEISGDTKSLKIIFEILAFFMLSGVGSTLLLPETKGKSLEELSNEEQTGFVKDS